MTRGLCTVLLLLAACSSDAAPSYSGGFVDRTAEAGITFTMNFLAGEQGQNFKINLYDHGSGVVVGDIDGDGDDDLYFINQLGANALYRYDGDGRFTDVTDKAGPIALADRICVSGAFNDIDNDGDQDLFVTSTRGGNALFRNDGKGKFEEITGEAGVAYVGHSQGATFFDADNDGDLDLFVTNTARWTLDDRPPRQKYFPGVSSLVEVIDSPIELNRFYRNDGKGRFTEATREARLEGVGWGGDTAVFDYDDDGDQDLFVSNMFGRSLIFRNDGKGRFEPDRHALGRTPFGTVGCRAFDYDGDGRLDLYLVDMHSDMWTPSDYDPKKIVETAKYKAFFGALALEPDFEKGMEIYYARKMRVYYRDVFFGNGLYRNLGKGKFKEVSDEAGAETWWPWGIGAADFDSDGHIDVFIASGMGYPFFYWHNYLLMNNGDGTFQDRAGQAGLDPPPGGKYLGRIGNKPATRSSRSPAIADFDSDGRPDLVVNNFNAAPNLFMNRWPKRNYISFRLEGTRSNRDAVGALVRVHVGDRVLVRLAQAAGGYLSQSSKTLLFGLGDAKKVDRCEIRWPSGKVQTIVNPRINQLHRIRE